MSSEAITRNDLIAILQELGHPFSPLDYYPIGSYFWTSESSYDPNISMGGTWELMDEGMTLVSAGQTYTIKSGTSADGGAAEVTLTQGQLPKISGSISPLSWKDNTASGAFSKGTANFNLKNATSGTANSFGVQHYNLSIGNDEPHENMPPYKAAYCWHRTA